MQAVTKSLRNSTWGVLKRVELSGEKRVLRADGPAVSLAMRHRSSFAAPTGDLLDPFVVRKKSKEMKGGRKRVWYS